MPWNTPSPNGALSVKANETKIAENMAYILATMKKDHYWAESGDLDGRHKAVSYQATDDNVLLGALVAGNHYVRKVSTVASESDSYELFYRNANAIYQLSPSFVSGVVSSVGSSFVEINVVIPQNVYGEILLYTTITGSRSAQRGHFRSDGTLVEGWMLTQSTDSTDSSVPLKLASGSDASGFKLKVRRSDVSSTQDWNYRITYRGL